MSMEHIAPEKQKTQDSWRSVKRTQAASYWSKLKMNSAIYSTALIIWKIITLNKKGNDKSKVK